MATIKYNTSAMIGSAVLSMLVEKQGRDRSAQPSQGGQTTNLRGQVDELI
jgi:hypothetical protein